MKVAVFVAVVMTAVPPLTQAQAPVNRDGQWTGKTSQGREISIRIENAAVAQLALEYQLPLEEPCQSSLGSSVVIKETGGKETMFFYPNSPGNEPPRITNAALAITRSIGGAPENVKMVLAGKFVSEKELTGTIELAATGCKGSAKLTWQATRSAARP